VQKVSDNVLLVNPALLEMGDEVETNAVEEQVDAGRAFFPMRKNNSFNGSNVTWYNELWRFRQKIRFPLRP
jgi:hypothetical protein